MSEENASKPEIDTPKTSSKPWYKSKGVIGGAVATLAGIAGLFGYGIGPDEQKEVVNLIISAVGLGGGVLGVYGRIKSKAKITSK